MHIFKKIEEYEKEKQNRGRRFDSLTWVFIKVSAAILTGLILMVLLVG